MFDLEFMRNNWLYIVKGLGVTLGVTLSALLLTVPLAFMVAAARRSPLLPLRALGTFYVWLVDGIPLLLQIFFVFLALPQLGIILPGFWAAVFVLMVYYSAQMSDDFYMRFAALESIREAGWRAFIPAMGKQFVAMIKDTTLIATTGFIHDVFWRANRAGRAEFHTLEALTIAAIVYLVLNTAISAVLGVRKARLLAAG